MRLALPLSRVAFPLLLAGACASPRPIDPCVLIHSDDGVEQGVATELGVVFLGHTTRSGSIRFTCFFSDGPSLESGLVERIGGGLYLSEAEILLPTLPLTFEAPPAGGEVLVLVHDGLKKRELRARVASHPSIEGLVLEMNDELRALHPGQVGAAVLVEQRDRRQLLGLVSGRVRIETPAGEHEFITVVGPNEMWRLTAYPRDVLRRRPWVYREDIL